MKIRCRLRRQVYWNPAMVETTLHSGWFMILKKRNQSEPLIIAEQRIFSRTWTVDLKPFQGFWQTRTFCRVITRFPKRTKFRILLYVTCVDVYVPLLLCFITTNATDECDCVRQCAGYHAGNKEEWGSQSTVTVTLTWF